MSALTVIVPAAVVAVAAVMVRRAVRRQPPRYHVVRELDPGWQQVRAVLRSRPDPEIDRYIRDSRHGHGRQQ